MEPSKDLYDTLSRLVKRYAGYVRDFQEFIYQKVEAKGGFGEVWIAEHKLTQKLVAIKEPRVDRLNKRSLYRFVNEIQTMIESRNLFIVPFVGFTVEPPYSIITEYVPNGTLKSLIFSKGKVDPTILTMIAGLVAYTMAYIHQRNVIHRDLKPDNILLSKEYAPKICDFGIARFEKSSMTGGLGSANYMAPELILKKNYTNKVDVYAFGILLGEMCERKRSFRGMSVTQIKTSVSEKGYRPALTKNATKKMKELIARCVHEDPNVRPSFQELTQIFLNGNVIFRNADCEKVASLMRKHFEDDSFFCANFSPPQITVDCEQLTKRLGDLSKSLNVIEIPQEIHHTEDVPHERLMNLSIEWSSEMGGKSISKNIELECELTDDIDSVLESPENPLFSEVLLFCSTHITEEFFYLFYQHLSKHFQSPSANFILLVFLKMMQENKGNIFLFWRTFFFLHFPFSFSLGMDIGLHCFDLICKEYSIKLVTILKFVRNLAIFKPSETLQIIIRNLPLEDNSVILFLLSLHRHFNKAEFIKFLFIVNDQILHDEISNLILTFIPEFPDLALKFLLHRGIPQTGIPFQTIADLLLTNSKENALSFLMKVEKFPLSKRFLSTLFKCPDAIFVLCKYADQSPEIFIRNPLWMKFPGLLRLFLTIFRKKESRYEISHSPLLPVFLRNLQNLKIVSEILKKIHMDRQVFENFTKSDLLNWYFAEENSLDGVIILHHFLRYGFHVSYLQFVPSLCNFVNEEESIYTLFVYLSMHKESFDVLFLNKVPELMQNAPSPCCSAFLSYFQH